MGWGFEGVEGSLEGRNCRICAGKVTTRFEFAISLRQGAITAGWRSSGEREIMNEELRRLRRRTKTERNYTCEKRHTQ